MSFEPPKIPHTIAEITEGDNIQPEPESHEEPHVTEPEDDEAEAEHPDFHEASAPLPDEEAAVPGLPDIPGDEEHHEEVVFVDGDDQLIDDNLEGEEEAPEGEEEEAHDASEEVEAPADA
uniref:ATPase n=1 Tax=Panagrellus redivivus TaxID=6233 RepID=A0A7E4W7S4_PANRE